MKISNMLVLIFCLGSTQTMFCPYLTKSLIQNYAVDTELEAILDEHSSELYKLIKNTYDQQQRHGHGVWIFDWLPDHYVKYDLARLDGLLHIKECIKKYHLDLLSVPKKRLYHIKKRPRTLSNQNYAIVIPTVKEIEDPQPLTLEQVQQLCVLVHKTYYVDAKRNNYIQVADGTLCLIDTEGTFDRSKLLRGFTRMIVGSGDLNTAYTEEALKYLFEELDVQLKLHPRQAQEKLRLIKRRLTHEQKPIAWDFISYFDRTFSHYDF